MADFDFTNLTIQECIEAKALLDNRLEELGEGKTYKSLEQKAMVLRQVKDNFASFLAQYGITLTSDKVSSEWVEKFKELVGNCLCRNLSGEIIIPKEMTSINNYAFAYFNAIKNPTSFRFEEGSGIKKLYGTFFHACYQTPTNQPFRVYLHEGLEEIGYKCFDTSYIEYLAIPSTVKKIDTYAFQSSRIQYISGCEGLEEIGSQAFQSASYLKSIALHDSLRTISSQAFNGCSALTKIIIPDSVTSLGHSVFYNCYALEEAKLPNTINKIQTSTFWQCKKLSTITIPDSVTEIQSTAFITCSALPYIRGKSVTKIGSSAFKSCTSMTFADFPLLETYSSEVSNNQSVFSTCSSMEYANLGYIQKIDPYFMEKCYVLKGIILKKSTPTVLTPSNAFSSCYWLSGTTNATYNPNGELGSIYVGNEEMTKAEQESLVEEYKITSKWNSYPADVFKPYYSLPQELIELFEITGALYTE